jgi:hypothetical protein
VKLFFEAGTVSAPDESIAPPRRNNDAYDAYDAYDDDVEDDDYVITEVRVKTKPITMEWNEWSALIASTPPDEATTPDPSWVDISLPSCWK